MTTESRPLHSLTVADHGHTFQVTLRGGSGEIHTWEYQGRFDDGAPIDHEAYRFKDVDDGSAHNLHHPDWTVTPSPHQSPHHVQLADALGVDPTAHAWDALVAMVNPAAPVPLVDTTREFTSDCNGRYSVTFKGDDAVVVDSDDLGQGNLVRTREWTVPRSGDGWSEVAGDDVWLEVKPAVVVVIHIPWDYKAGPSERVCT